MGVGVKVGVGVWVGVGVRVAVADAVGVGTGVGPGIPAIPQANANPARIAAGINVARQVAPLCLGDLSIISLCVLSLLDNRICG